MTKIIVFVILITVAIGLVLGLRRDKVKANPPKANPEVYVGLRKQAFEFTPENLGNVQTIGDHQIYGVFMEIGFPEAVVTLVTFVTGDASLYFSNGGGVVGGGAHESVGKSVLQFSKKADQFVRDCKKTTIYPTPIQGQTIFYILTQQGVYTAQAPEDDLGNQENPLSPLFNAGQDVITELRLTTDKK